MLTHKKTAALIFLFLILLLGACAQAEPTSKAGEDAPAPAVTSPTAEERTIVVGLVGSPTSLDPADHRERQSETVIRNMFDGLVTRDTRSGVHLELAEEMYWLDEQTLEIRLRQGVPFHDGVEMTADDVVFTFNRIVQENAIEYPEPHSSPRRALIAPLESIEKVDDYTVVMHFSGPWPSALQMLVHQQIISAPCGASLCGSRRLPRDPGRLDPDGGAAGWRGGHRPGGAPGPG